MKRLNQKFNKYFKYQLNLDNLDDDNIETEILKMNSNISNHTEESFTPTVTFFYDDCNKKKKIIYGSITNINKINKDKIRLTFLVNEDSYYANIFADHEKFSFLEPHFHEFSMIYLKNSLLEKFKNNNTILPQLKKAFRKDKHSMPIFNIKKNILMENAAIKINLIFLFGLVAAVLDATTATTAVASTVDVGVGVGVLKGIQTATGNN